jgi:hypothetical protein
MPILVPLADLLGLSRQVLVAATQYWSSLVASLVPTDGALMAMLALAGVPYKEWLRFALPHIAGAHGAGAGRARRRNRVERPIGQKRPENGYVRPEEPGRSGLEAARNAARRLDRLECMILSQMFPRSRRLRPRGARASDTGSSETGSRACSTI